MLRGIEDKRVELLDVREQFSSVKVGVAVGAPWGRQGAGMRRNADACDWATLPQFAGALEGEREAAGGVAGRGRGPAHGRGGG